MVRFITAMALILVVNSCAIYTEPKDGPTATVMASSGGGTAVVIYDNERCDNLRLTSFRDAVPFKVTAGKPVYFGRIKDTRGTAVAVYCSARVMFVPEPGATYELGWDMTFYPVTCSLPVTRLLADGKHQLEATARPFSSSTCTY
jgi:hypothetical protein